MWPASCCCGSVSKVNVLILFTGLCIFHWILLLTLTRCTSLAHRKTSVEHHVTDKIFFLFTRGGWGCLSDRWCVKLFWRHCITVIFPQSLFIIGRNHAHLPPSINGEEVERVCSFRTHTHCLKKKKKTLQRLYFLRSLRKMNLSQKPSVVFLPIHRWKCPHPGRSDTYGNSSAETDKSCTKDGHTAACS